MQIGRAGEVGIRVERDLDPVVSRLIEHRQQLGRSTLVDREAEMGVREVQRHARTARDLDAVGIRLERAQPVVAVMRRVVPAVLTHDLEQRDELVVVGVHPRRVGQTGREADRALLERLGQQPLHVRQLVGRRRTVVVAHRAHADRPVRREVGGVDRDPVRVEPVEVLADRAPAPVEPGRILVPAGELPAQLLEHLVGDRGVAEAVLAEHVERHALVHLRLVGRIDEQLQVGVRVHVDEARADEEPVRVDHALRGLVDATDVRDPAARDADVGAVPGIAGAVDHAAAADQHVEQG